MEGKEEAWKTLVHFGLGVKIKEIDIEKRLKVLDAEAKTAQNRYEAAIKRGDRYRAKQILKDMKIQ